MAVEFRLPDLGEGMTEGELVRWLIKPGDRVTLDQAIAEVQTDNAVVELPAPVAGTILSLDVEEGRVVPVGTRLLTIEDAAQDSVPTLPTSGADAAVAAAESAGASAAPAYRREHGALRQHHPAGHLARGGRCHGAGGAAPLRSPGGRGAGPQALLPALRRQSVGADPAQLPLRQRYHRRGDQGDRAQASLPHRHRH